LDSLSVKLSVNPLFTGLPPKTLEDLASNAIKRTFNTQEVIAHQGEIWPYLFFIKRGEIEAIKESLEGRAFIATSLKTNDVFWGLAFFIEAAPMPVMLKTRAEADIYIWSREYLVPIILDHGGMSWNLCQLMIARMQLASEIVEDLAFHPVMSRLAGLLLDIFGDAEDEFKTRELTLEEMAARIGTTREIVCRYMYKFAEKGAIQINRTELKINDRELLENQAER
jgi:CRP-like cAMP-binding protein